MVHFTNSFPLRTPFYCIAFLAVVISLAAVSARGQMRPDADVFQEISLKGTRPCAIESGGQVTALIKNGVELSVNEDFDCDGIADAYDKCVGMPDPLQIDSDGNGIGDVCEAATLVEGRAAVKARSRTATIERRKERSVDKRSRSVAEKRKAKAVDKRPRSITEKRRSRADRFERIRRVEVKVRDRKPTAKRKSKS